MGAENLLLSLNPVEMLVDATDMVRLGGARLKRMASGELVSASIIRSDANIRAGFSSISAALTIAQYQEVTLPDQLLELVTQLRREYTSYRAILIP